MTYLYTRERLQKLQRQKLFTSITIIASVIISVTALIILTLLRKHFSNNAILITNIIVSVFLCWAVYCIILTVLIPLKNEIAFYKKALCNKPETIIGKLIPSNSEITLNHKTFIIAYIEISTGSDSLRRELYIENGTEFPLPYSDESRAYFAIDNIIIAYETEKKE